MPALITVSDLVLRVGILVAFPVAAYWAMRTGGVPRLRMATIVALGLITAFALGASTPQLGNADVRDAGYWHVASRALVLYGLQFGSPVLVAALLVRALARADRPGWVTCALSIAGSVVAHVVGMSLAVWVVWNLTA